MNTIQNLESLLESVKIIFFLKYIQNLWNFVAMCQISKPVRVFEMHENLQKKPIKSYKRFS